MELIDIVDSNISEYKAFEKYFDKNLSMYMSRIYPDSDSNILKWYYINIDGKNIGSIWLEQNEIVKLGIFIADSKYRNKGYGKSAILSMLKYAEKNNIHCVFLNVRTTNLTALNLYKKIGFVEQKRFIKDNGISVISMKCVI